MVPAVCAWMVPQTLLRAHCPNLEAQNGALVLRPRSRGWRALGVAGS